MMETITIPVDLDTKWAFEQASEEERQELQVLVSLFFEERWVKKNVVNVMQEIATHAQERGLTPDILDEILQDE